MEFEWDESKNKSNQEKHGIDFNNTKDVLMTREGKLSLIYEMIMVKTVKWKQKYIGKMQ